MGQDRLRQSVVSRFPLLQAPSIRKLFAVSPTARRHVFSDIDVKKKNRQRETRGKQVAFVSKELRRRVEIAYLVMNALPMSLALISS